MKYFLQSFIGLCSFFIVVQAQTTYYPLQQSQPVIWGQGYKENVLTRFPLAAQASIPSDVWTNSQRSSGLQVRFVTNATSITVNYTVAAKYSNNSWYSDMGANGLDLYARKPDGNWYWLYPSSRTVGTAFSYTQIAPNDSYYNTNGYEYCLYLPPFATATSLGIQVNAGASFSFVPVPQEVKPIVVYGTSIVHGAVCSRPGNTWTNIISRGFPDRPVVNLGFSGVGRMEPEVIQVINQIDAAIFILDCLPNMSGSDLLSSISTRYSDAVAAIRTNHPQAAILFAEHPGYADMTMYLSRKMAVLDANNRLKNTYQSLVNQGCRNLYYLSMEELDLDLSSDMGDYIHPNDKGMHRYAEVYASKITEILTDLSSSVSPLSLPEIEIYPNPNQGQFTVKHSSSLEGRTVEIFDIKGNVICARQLSGSETNISIPRNAGHYVLQILQEGEKSTDRFIVY